METERIDIDDRAYKYARFLLLARLSAEAAFRRVELDGTLDDMVMAAAAAIKTYGTRPTEFRDMLWEVEVTTRKLFPDDTDSAIRRLAQLLNAG
jgi:hypothetical protein